jgi:hypothetical protein
MAFNDAPTELLGANYAADATNITLKISDFSELTAAEADETTGDSRKVLFALLTQVEAAVNALSAATKPGKMVISKSSTAPNSSGVFQTNFNISFTVAIGTADVAAE